MKALILAFAIFVNLSWAKEDSQNQSMNSDSDMAEIVFYRNSFVGKLVKASIYRVTDEETEYLGVLMNKNIIKYKVKPGKHRFMVAGEAADFMVATVEAGKTYYSVITPRMGAWKARFSMWPVRSDGTSKHNTASKDFAKAMKKVKPPKNPDKGLKWFAKNKQKVEKKKTKYWQKWLEKSEQDKAERTMTPDDGVERLPS